MTARWRGAEVDESGHLRAGGIFSKDDMNRQPTFLFFKSWCRRAAESNGVDLERLRWRQICEQYGSPFGGATRR